MPRVFVTGGTGVIGRALIERLVERGDDVVALARSAEAERALREQGCEVTRGEVCDVEAMSAGMAGCAVAYNLAGVNSLCVSDPEPMRRANVEGAVAAVHAAQRAGLPRLVHTSSAATIGEALALASEVADVQRNPRFVPRALATAAGTVVEYAFRLRRRKPPVCREMVRTLLHGHRYDGSRAERELGLRYTEPRETVRRTVEWARAEGLLRNV
jgi:nucleoside-diphosphate-sugar epimerase